MIINVDQSYKEALKPAIRSLFILIILLVIGSFSTTLQQIKGVSSYVPLHTFLEVISIVVSMMIFGVCWGIDIKDRAGNFLIISIIFLGVGLIDFLHIMSYHSMPDFITPSGNEKGIYFWLAARFLSAFALLIVSILPWNPIGLKKTRWYILSSVLIYVAIISWIGLWHLEFFPRTFIEGQGLTKFKIYFEYFLIGIYTLSAYLFLRQMNKPRPYDVVSLFVASCIMAMTELFFTLYVDVADIYNVIGHIYKVAAYAYVYKSIFLESIEMPIDRLNDSNKKLEIEIFDRQKIELQLAENEKLLSTILDTLPVAVFVKDIKKNFEFKIWNKFSEKLFGINAENLIGKSDYDMFSKKQADWFRKKDIEACQSHEIIEIPEEITQTQNGPIVLHTKKAIIRDKIGNPLFLLGVSDNITDIKNTTDDLRKALSARDEFLIIASHELKTPITSLKLRLQILLRNTSLDSKVINQLEIILSQVDRLTKLINTILDVSRIQTGKFIVELSSFDLNQSIAEVLEEFAEEILNSHCHVEVDIPPNVIVFWDKARIEQVLINLLSNAIKYAPASNISIIVTQDKKRTTLIIKDTGPGIPKEKQALIFNRFERAGAPVSVSGLGLGLYISKQIIEAMSGVIKVEGQEGKGTSFTIELPNNPTLNL